MNWDFDSVHIVRGKKVKNTELWPNLATNTSPNALLTTLKDKVDKGRKLYVATNERETSLFDPLKDKYETHFLDEFKDLWGEESGWAQGLSNAGAERGRPRPRFLFPRPLHEWVKGSNHLHERTGSSLFLRFDGICLIYRLPHIPSGQSVAPVAESFF